MLLTISLEPTRHSTKLFVVMKFERHFTWPTFQWLIWFSGVMLLAIGLESTKNSTKLLLLMKSKDTLPDQLYCFVVLGLDRNETASTPTIPSPRVPSLEEEKEAVKVSIPLITDQVSVWKINGVRTGCKWASGLQQTTLSLITCKFINVILSSLSTVDISQRHHWLPCKMTSEEWEQPDSILMMCHYPGLSTLCDWLNINFCLETM